jgi:hypothetical protein
MQASRNNLMRYGVGVVLLVIVVALPTLSSAAKRRAVRHPGPLGIVAVADSYSVQRGATLVRAASEGVLANDHDGQSRPLTAQVFSGTSHGTLTLNPDGGFTYVNDGSAATSDSFSYKAIAGAEESNPTTATIVITPPAPQAANDTYSVAVGATLNVPAPGVLVNDTVNEASIASYGINGTEQTTLGGATPTAQAGTVTLQANGAFTFHPANGFTGSDTFKYVLTNATGSATAQVSVTVTPNPPTAANDAFTAQRNTQLSVPAPGVIGNDTLNGANIVSYGAATGAEQTSLGVNTPTEKSGTVRLNGDGSLVYNPPGGFSGSDSFRYVVSNAGGSATAIVAITVQPGSTPDFIVHSPGFFYTFSGVSGQDPVLTLQRGRTYVFEIDTDLIHPFQIIDAPAGSVTNNNISQGTLTFRVPTAIADYRYRCSIHLFGNTITTSP